MSSAVQTLAHRGHLRAWQPDRMGDGAQGVKALAEQLTSEMKPSGLWNLMLKVESFTYDPMNCLSLTSPYCISRSEYV